MNNQQLWDCLTQAFDKALARSHMNIRLRKTPEEKKLYSKLRCNGVDKIEAERTIRKGRK